MTSKWIGLVLGLTISAGFAEANEIVFGRVGYEGLSGSNVTYALNGGTLHTGIGSTESPIRVGFGFENVPGMYAVPSNVDAFMTWSVTRATGAAGDVNCAAVCSQQMTGGTLSIRAVNGGALLLQATFSGMMSGALTGSALGLAGSNVVFKSDFLDFSKATQLGLNFNFDSVLSNLMLNGGNIADLLASGSGWVSASGVTSAPEPATLGGGVLGAALLVFLYRRKRARV